LAVRFGDMKPVPEGRMDGDEMFWPDVVAMRVPRPRATDASFAVCLGEVPGLAVEAVDRFQSAPYRVVLPVPGEFVGVHEPPRRNGADDDPRSETIARREPQVSRRFPASSAKIIERLLGVGWQWINGFRLRPTEIEGNDGGDPRVERPCHGRWI